MTKALGVALTVVFVTASVVGTVWNGWFLGEVLAPAHTSPLAALLSPSLCLATLAAIAECLRLALALQAEGIWRKSRFQGTVFAGPLWLVCTMYCTLMPLLTLVIVPLPPITDSPLLAFLAVAWAFIQIAAGLLPGIAWPAAAPTAAAEAALPQSFAEIREAAPAHLAPKSAASVEDFLQVLARLSELPAGSNFPSGGRIGADGEIVISQAALAIHAGRSKPTVRRWLQQLERRQHISKSATGKETRIRLQQHRPALNGDARDHRLDDGVRPGQFETSPAA